MSCFIRIPDPAAPTDANGNYIVDPEQGLFLGVCATDVTGARATPSELADNHGKGALLRMHAVLVQDEPPTYAFYSQALGLSKWLTYNATADNMYMADTITEGGRFTMRLQDSATGGQSVWCPAHKVFLTVRYVASTGRYEIYGNSAYTPAGMFTLARTLGTGPLMPGMPYLIKSVFGTQLSADADGTGLVQTKEGGQMEEFVVEKGIACEQLCAGTICYSFRSLDKGYLGLNRSGEVGFTLEKSVLNSFQLAPCDRVAGYYRLIHNVTYDCIRADSESMKVTLGMPIVRDLSDSFQFQCCQCGPVQPGYGFTKATTDVQQHVPLTICACPRDHPELPVNAKRLRAEADARAASMTPAEAAKAAEEARSQPQRQRQFSTAPRSLPPHLANRAPPTSLQDALKATCPAVAERARRNAEELARNAHHGSVAMESGADGKGHSRIHPEALKRISVNDPAARAAAAAAERARATAPTGAFIATDSSFSGRHGASAHSATCDGVVLACPVGANRVECAVEKVAAGMEAMRYEEVVAVAGPRRVAGRKWLAAALVASFVVALLAGAQVLLHYRGAKAEAAAPAQALSTSF